jgi:MFS family permease
MRQRPLASWDVGGATPTDPGERIQAEPKVVARLETNKISARRAARLPSYPNRRRTARHPRIFYGWYVVSAVGLVLMTTTGLAFYNLAVLLDAFIAERGFPVGLTSGATASFFVASGLGGVLAGRLMDRVDARMIIILGACGSAIALGCTGLLRRPSELYAFHLIFGFCYGFCGLVPATTIVARWFEARRALALSIASTGLSLGGVIVTPLSAYLIHRLGIAGAAPWMGLLFFVGVVPVTATVVRSTPQEVGLVPDGSPLVEASQRAGRVPTLSYGQASRSRLFISITVAYLFGLGAQVGAVTHLFRMVSTREDTAAAASAVASLAIASVVGRLIGGWALLRVGTRGFAVFMLAAQTLALAILATASQTWILPVVVLFGVTVGNVLMLHPLLLAETFGTRHYGRIYSVSNLIATVGVAGGPALVGLIFEATSGYAVPYLTLAVASLMSCSVLLLAHPRKDK